MGEWVKEQVKYLEHSAKELTVDGDKGNYTSIAHLKDLEMISKC